MSLRRFVILAVVLALTFTTGMAVQAGGGKGKVMKLDSTANVVVLEDGSMYRVVPDTVFIVEEKPVKFEALQPGTTYEFRVGSQDAVNAAESGGAKVNWSGWVEVTVAKDAHVSRPLTLEEPLTIWDTGADLTWTAYRDPATGLSEGLNGYAVYRGAGHATAQGSHEGWAWPSLEKTRGRDVC